MLNPIFFDRANAQTFPPNGFVIKGKLQGDKQPRLLTFDPKWGGAEARCSRTARRSPSTACTAGACEGKGALRRPFLCTRRSPWRSMVHLGEASMASRRPPSPGA